MLKNSAFVIINLAKGNMNRKEFLQKLLEKADRGHDYVRTNLYDASDNMSPPATIKRMQILQMGMGKIYLPQAKPSQPVFQKQISSNNRKILVLQKVKSMSNRKETSSNNNKSLKNSYVPQDLHFPVQKQKPIVSSPACKTAKTQISEKQQIQQKQHNSQTYSPIKHSNSAFNKRSEGVCDSIKKMKINRIQNRYALRSVQFKKEPSTPIPLPHSLVSRRPSVSRRSHQLNNLKEAEEKESRAAYRREIRKNYSKTFLPTPKISSKSYIVYEKINKPDKNSNSDFKIHLAFNSKIRVQVASLTKIMTCIVALQLCEKFSVDASKEQIKIGKFQSSIGGTSAKIETGDVYTLEDMFYGLMLPSGNDASLAIAVWGGKKLIFEEQSRQNCVIHKKRMKKEYYERFIQEMNKKARSLEMSKTTYANSHGLVNTMNRSCAHDIAHLSQYAMKNPQFRKIVSTKFYKTQVKMFEKRITFKQIQKTNVTKPKKNNMFDDQDQSDCDETSQTDEKEEYQQIEEEVYLGERQASWQNTHKLLHTNPKQYLGIKTGVTTAAGPCLSSCVISECGRTFFIVVLNCKKMLLRFKETDLLKKWIFKQQGLKKVGKKNGPISEITSVASEQNNDLSDVEQNYGPDDD